MKPLIVVADRFICGQMAAQDAWMGWGQIRQQINHRAYLTIPQHVVNALISKLSVADRWVHKQTVEDGCFPEAKAAGVMQGEQQSSTCMSPREREVNVYFTSNFHSSILIYLCVVLGYSKVKLEWTNSPVDGAGICTHMCQLKIALEAQFMLHSWALAGKWNSMNTQWKKQPGTQWDKENIARISGF